MPTSPLQRHEALYIYYAVGSCKKGADCPFLHNANPASTSSLFTGDSHGSIHPLPHRPVPGVSPNSLACTKVPKNISRHPESRNLKGAIVEFGPGAEVANVEFSSDYSGVQISCMQSDCSVEQLQSYLAILGEIVPSSCIRIMKGISTLPVNAHVKVKDPEFAKRLKARVDSGLERQFVPELDVDLQEFMNKGESISTRLQMGWVSCSWYKPSRHASLFYEDKGKAKGVVNLVRGRDFMIRGRLVSAALEVPYTNYGAGTSRIVFVKITNLDVESPDATLEQYLLGLFKPDIIVLGQASDSADKVKVILKTIGPLESWQYDTRSSATQIKATAQFRSAEDARRAISKFNEAKLLILGNSKIFLSPLASVVFHVPFVIYDAIQEDLDILQHLQRKTRNVHMEVFPPGTSTQIAQNLMSLRIRGENTTAVAEAKGTLEKILAGDAAMDGDIKI